MYISTYMHSSTCVQPHIHTYVHMYGMYVCMFDVNTVDMYSCLCVFQSLNSEWYVVCM